MAAISSETESASLGINAAELADLEANLAYREQEEWFAEEIATAEFPAEARAGAPEAIAAAGRVSQPAFKLIVDYETGGKAYYEQTIRSRPIWPKASSGITIGFGYDLGYVGIEEFRTDWAELLTDLSQPQRKALEGCVGFHSGKHSASQMEKLLTAVRNIVVSWDVSERVFKAGTLPKFASLTERALPNSDALNGDCFGTLVSLTFNRGASYGKAHKPATDPRDRYREMRAIRADTKSGNLADIPRQIRSMIRIWVGTPVEKGMRRRRADEAELFLAGLQAETPVATIAVPATNSAEAPAAALPLPADADSVATAGDDDLWTETTEDDIADAARSEPMTEAVATGASWAKDEAQPDYSHLGPNLPKGLAFSLTAADLQLLARLNDFDLARLGDTPVLFGLRGAGIVKDHTDPDGIVLVDQRPDHTQPRCVIGIWDRAARKVSVFPGSTVPNQAALQLYKTKGTAGNLLPTGLYGYVCGAHTTKNKSTPGCFLLRKPDLTHRVVVVRRSKDDLSYQRTDIVHRCGPGDNIHPTFFSQPTSFSSLGCQTIVGTFKNGAHVGSWASFRRAAGFTDTDGSPGKLFLYILLTGAEARIASSLRVDNLATDSLALRRLRRLRAGASSEAVTRLQQQLGLPDPDGNLGPFTVETLHAFQKRQVGVTGSDGIFTPDLDTSLGWQVFGSVGV